MMNSLFKKTIRLALLLSLPLWAGCQGPDPGDVAVSEIRAGRKVIARTAVAPPEDPHAVKSAFAGQDHAVANYNLLVFEAGTLVAKYYKDSGSELSFEVMADRAYNYYCVANVGDCTGAFSVGETPESWMESWLVEAPVAGADGLPMAWSDTDVRFSKARMRAGARLEILLTRLVSQYDIVLDKSGLSQFSFTATSLSLCGPVSVKPFATSKAASLATRTDYALPGDLSLLNGGQKAAFYPLENRYGELLSGNTDPWRKVPANLSDSDHPTYIELEGKASIADGSGLEIPLTYRFFLGRNATSDFDVRRNEVNTVTLALTDEAIGREEPSWKVEKGSYTDSRSLSFEDEEIYVPGGGSADEMILRMPANLKYVVTLDPALTAAGVGLSAVTPGEPVDWDVLTFTAPEGIAPTEGKVRVRTLDGRKSDELLLRAGRRLRELHFGLWPDAQTERFHSDTTYFYDGKIYAHVYAVYTDDSREDITASLAASDFQFDADLLTCSHDPGRSPGLFTPRRACRTQIRLTRTIDGVTLTAEANLNVLPKLTGLIGSEESSLTLQTGGETHQFSLYAIYDGAERRDVTAEAVWTVDDEEILINDGGGSVTTKLKTGTTNVSAAYTENGVTRQWRIEVRVVRTPVELRIFPNVVYLPNAGSNEYLARESVTEYAAPNERIFRLTAYFHDGTFEDVSYAPGKTRWTDDLPLRYQDGDTWHVLGVQSFNASSTPGRMIIYRAYTTELNSKVILGNNTRYTHRVHEAGVVTADTPRKLLSASYTLNGVTLTADVMGTLVNDARPQRITITPNPQEAYAGGCSVQFKAALEYDDGSSEDITAQALWSADGLVTNDGGGRFTTGTETGSTRVHARYTASGVTVNGEAGLSVNPRVMSNLALEFNSGTGWTDSGGDVNLGSRQDWRLRVTFDNGDVDYVSKGFQLTSSDPGVVTVSGSATTAVTIGHSDIRADYGGMSAGPLRLTVRKHDYSHELSVEPKSVTIDSDASRYFDAWFITKDNGVETAREDVSGSCVWSVSSGLAAYVTTEGIFRVAAKGNNTSLVSGAVEALYERNGENYSAHATLRIRAPFVPSLSVSVNALEWDYDEYGADCGLSVAVTGNVNWKAELVGGDTLFSLSDETGEGNAAIQVYPSGRNGGASERTARLRIYDSVYGLECFISLTQLSFDRRKGIGRVYNKLVVTPAEVTIDHDGSFIFTATLFIYRDAAMTDLFRSFDVSLWDWSHWTSSDESAAVMHSPLAHGPVSLANPLASGVNTRTGNAFKETTVTCFYGPEIASGMTISDAATLRVKDVPDASRSRLSVRVDPANIGCTGRAQASALLQRSSDGGLSWDIGEDVTASVSWSSSDPSAASVSSDGTVTGCNTSVAARTTRITARYDGVTPPLSSGAELRVSGVSPFLDVTPGQLSWNWDDAGPAAGKTVTVSGNLAWSVTVPAGFTASRTTGTGDGTLTVWPDRRNTSTATDVTGTLRISAAGVAERTVALSQGHSSGTDPSGACLSFDRNHYELVSVSGGIVSKSCDFTLTLHAGDGTTRDVTALASYAVQGGVSVDGAAGTLTATAAANRKTLAASYGGMTAEASYSAEDLCVPVSLGGRHVEAQGDAGREFLVGILEVTLERVLTGTSSREDVTADVKVEPDGPIVCDGLSSGLGIRFHFTAAGSGSVCFRYTRDGVTVERILDLTCAPDNTIKHSWR